MIEEKEIRLGNWFHHNKEWSNQNRDESAHYFKFESIHWYWMHEGCFYLENIDPIHLTEEWLVKLGAKEVKAKRGVIKEFVLKTVRLELSNSHNFYYKNSSLVINSLHQLQNLYFALKGKELEVK